MAALKLSVMSVLVLHLTVLTFATRPAEDLAASSLDVRAQLAMRSLHLPQMPQSILDDGSRSNASNASNASSASGANNSSPSGSLKARGPGPSSLAQASSSAGTEYELHLERRSQSKVMLIFVVFLGLGFCGVDHCLVGNFILGTLKLLTVGGFGFWFLLDWMLIVFNCVNQYSTLTGFGWEVVFTPCSIEDACRIGQVTCLLHAPFVLTLLKAKLSGRSVQSSVQQPAASTVAFLRQKGLVSESPAQWEVDHVFEALDKNRDGIVTATELKEGLAALGCEITDEQVSQLLASAAGSEPGRSEGINRSELGALLTSSQHIISRRASKQVASASSEGQAVLQLKFALGASLWQLSSEPLKGDNMRDYIGLIE